MREIMRAALVIARRDFTAIIFSKSFILFLVGPLLPVVFGIVAGSLGDRMTNDSMRPMVGVALPASEGRALEAARKRLVQDKGERGVTALKNYASSSNPQALLARKGEGIIAVLSGSLQRPVLTGKGGDVDQLEGDVSLLVSIARAGTALPETQIATHIVAESKGSEQQSHLLTARAAQVLLFMLTMLLAGMVLSNMVEEKANKII